ncbi:MAG: hypothetical protein HAW67_07665, partial [Endozoicomonadaceae bacterium]|nr:hypothetical protein [Endozoicomonadaceae bacterium]
TSDPIGLQGGINTYSYAGQNGVRFVDPKGLRVNGLGKVKGNASNNCFTCEAVCVWNNMLIPGGKDAIQLTAKLGAMKAASDGLKLLIKFVAKRVVFILTIKDVVVTIDCIVGCE